MTAKPKLMRLCSFANFFDQHLVGLFVIEASMWLNIAIEGNVIVH